VVRLWEGVLVSNSLCGGASFGGSRSLSKMLDLASHRAFVTGEWYIPGHRLMGFRPADGLASLLTGRRGLSKGEANVETTGMVLEEGEEFKSMEYWNFCETNFGFLKTGIFMRRIGLLKVRG
jgi:hypothetical protein